MVYRELDPDPLLVIAANRVFAGAGSVLVCIDPQTGQELWRIKLKGTSSHSLLVDGERLFVAGSGTVACCDLDGRRLWSDGFRGKGVGATALAIGGRTVQADVF